MRVRMVASVSGTRNGEDWPAPGGVVDLPEDEAAGYLAAGICVAVDEVRNAGDPSAAKAEKASGRKG